MDNGFNFALVVLGYYVDDMGGLVVLGYYVDDMDLDKTKHRQKKSYYFNFKKKIKKLKN